MKTSQQVLEDATSLLEDTEIVDLLSTLGALHLVGSYAADLMCDPDIDIVVVTDTPQESAIEAINILARKEIFQKLEYGDFKNHSKENRPESFIVNARKEWKGATWEIETWFLTEMGDRLEIVEKLKNLSNKDRRLIIEKKKQRSLSGNSKYNVSPWKIYQEYI